MSICTDSLILVNQVLKIRAGLLEEDEISMEKDGILYTLNLNFKRVYVSRDNLKGAHELASQDWARGNKLLHVWC